jgi:hypothetical protein
MPCVPDHRQQQDVGWEPLDRRRRRRAMRGDVAEFPGDRDEEYDRERIRLMSV